MGQQRGPGRPGEGRTHGCIATYNAGCHEPCCRWIAAEKRRKYRAAARERARRAELSHPQRTMAPAGAGTGVTPAQTENEGQAS